MKRFTHALAAGAFCVALIGPAVAVAGADVQVKITLEGLVALYSYPVKPGAAIPDDGEVGTTWALFPHADTDTQGTFLANGVAAPALLSHGMNEPMTSHHVAIRIPLMYITGNAAQKGEVLLDPTVPDPYDPKPTDPRHTGRIRLTPPASTKPVMLSQFGLVPAVPAAGGDGKTPASIDGNLLADNVALEWLGAQLKLERGWTLTAEKAPYVNQAGQKVHAKVRLCHRASAGDAFEHCKANPEDRFSTYFVAAAAMSAAPVLTIESKGHTTPIALKPIDGRVELTIQNAPSFAILDSPSPPEAGAQFEHSKLYYMLAGAKGKKLPTPYYFPLRGGVEAPGRYCSSSARFLTGPKE